jgi:enoyl-CoA hydratase/carnithine racemase
MNCINVLGNAELSKVWNWYDSEPSLRSAVFTGRVINSKRPAFCAGMDLKQWNSDASSNEQPRSTADGFAGLSNRRGKKPVVSAVHGICFGGGMEAAANTDLIIAHESSTFALPEVSRGVAAIAGVLPRLPYIVGLQRANELALTGRVLTAEEAKEWGFVNEVVKGDVVEAALGYAKKINAQSPDSIIVSRAGIRSAFDGDGARVANEKLEKGLLQRLREGENYREGLRAFVEKREVRWVDSKL